MPYKYEIDEKAKAVKVRVLIAVYVMFVVSAILIGIAVRLQQLQSIATRNPSASGASGATAMAISLGSDPNYGFQRLHAVAYCDVVNAQGQSTGQHFPLQVRFFFKQVKRDVGQYQSDVNYLSAMCNSATPGDCSWATNNTSDQARCLNNQTAAQCATATTVCGDTAVSGALFTSTQQTDTVASSYVAEWPASDPGVIIFDDNEVDVILNTSYGELLGNQVVRNGVTYTINKSSLSVVDASSIFPIYNWSCNNSNAACTGSASCTNAGTTYNAGRCSFNSTSRTFSCPSNKYIYYGDLTQDKVFFYSLSNRAGQVQGSPNWVRMGYAHSALADDSYANATLGAGDDPVTFRGNIAKFRFTCTAGNVTVTPTPIIDAVKTGPVCVERIAPNNTAPFTITVRNNGTTAATVNSVEDALPQGFTYRAGSTRVNGVAVTDAYVTTVNSGSSQKVTFAPPAGQNAWTIAAGGQLIINFTALAGNNAVTGANTNRVVVNIEGTDAIDNISYSFQVEQTCTPITGVLDQPIVIFALSGALVLFGLYLLYVPSGSKILEAFSGVGKKLEKSVVVKAKQLEEKADVKKQFEKRVLQRGSKKK